MSSIDFSLPNFPTLSQLHEDTGQLYPNVNADMDCVPTSIAAALTWFLRLVGTLFFGDEIIDAVYGSGYTGGTAAVQYVNYCAARGVKLYAVNGTPQELVTAIHTYLHENCPVLVTVPGHWNDPQTSGQNPGNVTHVMVVCGDGPGLIQVMNPWTGAFEVYSDAWFHVKLCYGQVWPMEKMTMAPDNWNDDGTTLTASNGVKITTGFRSFILAQPHWYSENVPLGPEHEADPVSSVTPDLTGTRIDFVYCSLVWRRAQDVVVFAPVNAEIAKVQSDLTAEQTEVVNLKMQANADATLIGQLKAQITNLMSQPGAGPAGANEAIAAMKAIEAAMKAINGAPTLIPVGVQTKPLPAVQ